MSAPTEHRKLAAIMFTDMVGYSALSQRNEALALSSVPQGRPRIAQRFIAGLGARSGKVPQGRKKVGSAGRRVGANLSPLWGLATSWRFPSVETLGYGLSPSGLEP
jgi:class 3 adenylate cyclase